MSLFKNNKTPERMVADAVAHKGVMFMVGDKKVYATPLSISQVYEIAAIGSQLKGLDLGKIEQQSEIAALFNSPDNIIPIGKMCNVALYPMSEDRVKNEQHTLDNLTAKQAEELFMWAIEWMHASFFLTATIATTMSSIVTATKTTT